MSAVLFDALAALQQSPPAALLRQSLYLYPLVNALHILGIGLLVGAILPADLRLLGLFRDRPLHLLVPFLTGAAAFGLALAVATGILLFSVKPLEYAVNAAFLSKLALVAAGTANALALRLTPAWRTAMAGGPATARLRLGAAVSFMVWPAALLSGRFIAFL